MAGINLFNLLGNNTGSIYGTIYNNNMFKNTTAVQYRSYSSSKSYSEYRKDSKYGEYGKNSSSTEPEAQDYLSGLKEYGGQLKAAADTITQRFPPIFDQLAASLSNDKALSVTDVNAVAANKNKTLEVDINRLAAAQKNESFELDASAKNNMAGYNRFSIAVDGQTYDFGVSVSAGDSNKAAQQKLADAINKRDIGVKASVAYDSETKKSSLVLESKKTGEANAFEVTQASGGLMAIGINNTTQEAQDARYSVNGGMERRSSSNTVNLGSGITAELKAVTEESVEIGLKKDVNKMVNAVYELVNNYNGLMETAKGYKSTGARQLEEQLKSIYKSSSYSLERAGIAADKNGYLKIDTDKLKRAAEDGTLKNAMGVNSSSTSYGFANRLKQTARSVDSNPAAFLGKDETGAANQTGSSNSSQGYYANKSGRSNTYYNYMLNKLTGVGLLFDSMF